MNRTDSRLRGLLATLTLVAFVVGVPVVLIAIDALLIAATQARGTTGG